MTAKNVPPRELEKVVLVAVVEFPEADGCRLRKIRILERSCTGWGLYKAIVDTRDDDRIANVAIVEIYDTQQHAFISLLRPDMKETNIIDKFGPRVRCVVREKKSLETASAAITGRFYTYNDTTGLEIAGKLVFVKEMPNIPGAGTGLNVWDGAILL